MITFLVPVLNPEKILCVGVSYANRNEEYKDNDSLPKYPSLFFRSPKSLVGHHEPLVKPLVSNQFDYEGEIVIVVGKRGRHIAEAQALDHIAGITICNEGTVRDWV
jgi:2-keto-4-pentenoate hydratase/2-oxohepta-3-ene-1,7-dioic acid hydratase in catechol pathway